MLIAKFQHETSETQLRLLTLNYIRKNLTLAGKIIVAYSHSVHQVVLGCKLLARRLR